MPAEAGLFVALGIVVVIAILVASYYLSEDARIRRALRTTPKATLATFPEGAPARAVAPIVPGPTIEAPLSGRACVYYEVVVEERRSANNRTYWRRVAREVRGISFVIDDGTGRALVEPDAARISLAQDVTTRSGTFDDPDPREQAFLARQGVASSGWVFNKTLRYKEAVLEVGEMVAIVGLGVREPDPDAPPREGYREGPPTRVRLNGSSRFPLLVSDKPDTMT